MSGEEEKTSDSLGFASLDPALNRAVEEAFRITSPSEIQQACLQQILSPPASDDPAAQDLLIRAKTGSGKTLAFLLPLLHQLLQEGRREESRPRFTDRAQAGTLGLILVPTRELAAQTQATLSTLLGRLRGRDHWLVAGSLSGGDRRKTEKERLRKGMHLVVGTPGRILDHLENTERWQTGIQTMRWIVLDEADRLQDSGFEKSIKSIMDKIQAAVAVAGRPRPRILLCSATIGRGERNLLGLQLNNPLLIVPAKPPPSLASASGADRQSPGQGRLDHYYLCTPTKFRLAVLSAYLEEALSAPGATAPKVVLFTICCDTVDYLYSLLSEASLGLLAETKGSPPPAIHRLHGNMEHKMRMQTFTAFTKAAANTPALLICTDIAARGLNLANVSCIIQYDAPCDLNDYIHRAGRTARLEEQAGKSVLFLMPSERGYLAELAKRELAVSAIRWQPLVESVARRQRLATTTVSPSSSTLAKTDGDDEEEEEAASGGDGTLPQEVKRRVLLWLEGLQTMVKGKAPLLGLAKKAYLSFIRAYATHPAAEKAIFHPKRLHLGHLAATFLLAEAPKSLAHQQQQQQQRQNTVVTRETGKRKAIGEPAAAAKPRRRISEFDAGDADASFMQPRSTIKESS